MIRTLTLLGVLTFLSLPLASLNSKSVSKSSPKPDAEIKTYDLENFVVKGNFHLPKPESWQYAQLGEFEILSNAPENVSQRLLQDFQKFREALDIAHPIAIQPLAASTIILCYRNNKFEDFVPSDISDRNGFVSQLLRDREKMAIVLDLSKTTYDVPTRASPQEFELNHRRQLYREYTRFLFTQTEFPPPPWLLEGNIQIILDTEIYGRIINYGKLDMNRGAPDAPDNPSLEESDPDDGPVQEDLDANTMANYLLRMRQGGALSLWTTDPPFNVALGNKKLLPMAELFAVNANDDAAKNPLVNLPWAKQAHAFVHFCKFGADKKFEPAYDLFVTRLANEPLTEKLFQECFLLSYEQMLKKLSSYVYNPRHRYRHYKLAKDEKLGGNEVVFRDATQGEVARIKGDAQKMAGLHAEALFTYRVAYERAERDPKLLASLAQEELRAGQTESAREYLESAIAQDVALPSAWTTLARLWLDDAKADPASTGRISAEQTANIMKPLLKARSLQPPIPETYSIMADLWKHSSIKPTSAAVDLVGEGVFHFPLDTNLLRSVTELYLRAGNPKRGAEVATFGLGFITDTTTRSSFESLINSLESP